MLYRILFWGAPLIVGLSLGIGFDNFLFTLDVPIIGYMVYGIRLYQISLRQQRLERATNILHFHGRGEELMKWLERAGVYHPAVSDSLEGYRSCRVNLRALTGFRAFFPYNISDRSLAILVNSMCHLDEETVYETAKQLVDLYGNKKRLDKFFQSMIVARHDKTSEALWNTTTEILAQAKKEAELSQQTEALEKAFGNKKRSSYEGHPPRL